ncbi:MAG: acetylxylan esterase [Fimbriimonadaceae bacterium]|nr:acetylxylan esterase [Fimbriimonadaceae bacterium]
MDASRMDGHSHARQLLERPKAFEWGVRPNFPRGEWTAALRQEVARCVGLRPPGPPPQPRVVESVRLDGYRRDALVYESLPGLDAFAFLLVPDGLKSPAPGVLCLPGHGRGVDPVVGIAADGSQRPIGQPDEYASDFALQCVANGYVALAVEHLSFGRRSSPVAAPMDYSCTMDAMALLMLGETMIGRRVHDARRGLDILASIPEVDSARLATMGISGGGTVSLFTGCLDERVSACAVSGYFCTFLDSILAMEHCVDNFAPGLGALVEMPDLAALVAPRRLFVESGTRDPIFPLPGFQKAVARARTIYEDLGVPERFGHEVFEGDHVFHGAGAFRFLNETFG